MSYQPIPPFVPGYLPIPNVTPFTYRDGLTYIRKLEDIVRYIDRVIVPYLNSTLDSFSTSFVDEINALTEQVNNSVNLVINSSIDLQDPVLAGVINDTSSESRGKLDSLYASVSAIDGILTSIATVEELVETGRLSSEAVAQTIGLTWNVLDFGVERESSEDQTPAILAAFNSKPGETFRFPPGNYRLDTSLKIASGNSIILESGARLYAGSAMVTLVDFDNESASVSGYVQDRGITGEGVIDGNLLADNALRISSVIRYTVNGLTIVDPVKKGILTNTLGAEVIVSNVRIHNTGTTNVVDSVGIQANMSDCHFSDVIIRDFTVGVHDNGSANEWKNVHPWLGDSSQIAARYPNSIAFLLTGNSNLVAPYADTYRTSFKTGNTVGGSYARARLVNPRVYCSPGNVSSVIAAGNPGIVIDTPDAAIMVVTGGFFQGHPDTPHEFVAGNNGRLTVKDSTSPLGVSNLSEYKRGVRIGVRSFTPTIYGSVVEGLQSYTTQQGTTEVRDGYVRHTFVVAATLGSTIQGNLRIGGLPMPLGAASEQSGQGVVTYNSGVAATSLIDGAGSGTALNATVINQSGGSSTQVAATPSAVVQIWGFIDCPFTYPG